mmetsp:Transcript_1993/g.2472  ORF Transcript_1993/g.2472 Transcript_1993/m.2472 type:complete len:112 (+) Transcript_1993:40-375(+)
MLSSSSSSSSSPVIDHLHGIGIVYWPLPQFDCVLIYWCHRPYGRWRVELPEETPSHLIGTLAENSACVSQLLACGLALLRLLALELEAECGSATGIFGCIVREGPYHKGPK